MITLALDAATDHLTVAVGRAGGGEWEAHLPGARRHARDLVPVIDRLLAGAGTTPAGIGQIVLADGPGSFTGLRVATAVAKALVRAGGVTLRVTPSLLGRAWRASGGSPGLVLACAPALRGEVYAGWYRITAADTVVVERAASALRPEALRAGAPPDLIAGDAPEALLDALGRAWAVPVHTREAARPDARALLHLASVPGGTTVVEAAEAWEPVYGRPAEAQARWEQTHGRPLPDPVRAG